MYSSIEESSRMAWDRLALKPGSIVYCPSLYFALPLPLQVSSYLYLFPLLNSTLTCHAGALRIVE